MSSRLAVRAVLQHSKRAVLHRSVRGYATVTSDIENVDVAIVGGGPVGLALACALSSSVIVRDAASIALIEGGDLERVRNWNENTGAGTESSQFSNRVVSITNASRHFLEDIDAWAEVDTSRTCPVEEMQVWDGISDSRIVFSGSHSLSRPDSEMARLTEVLNLQRGLLRRLDKLKDVDVIDKTRVSSIEKEDRDGSTWPIVTLANGKRLRARLLVGADGFNSPVRSYADISSFGWSYNTQAIVATLNHAPRLPTAFVGGNTAAYQRFLPTGPIAFLPLTPTVSSLVWSTKPQIAAALLKLDPSVLAVMVNAAFRLPDISLQYLHDLILEADQAGETIIDSNILEEVKWRESSHQIDSRSAYSSSNASGEVGIPPEDSDMLPPLVTSIQAGTPASFPLRLNHTDSYIGEGNGARTVLVGDAAHTVHPLAGQGLNLGLADAQSLGRCIETAVLQGGDIGSYTALLPYARDRYFANHKILAVTDKLHKLYSTRSAPVVWARSTGLEVLNELDTVKEAMMLGAGSEGTVRTKRNTMPWNVAATGLEIVNGAADMAKLVVGGVVGGLVNGVRNVVQKK
ncbi:hypothetical protein M422DRAFT_199919 [Sphaerobolus stellatus SS14]|nr:hypothetical protein M422DRAFT_199919 [Sphaerobolus stellatus SS14]